MSDRSRCGRSLCVGFLFLICAGIFLLSATQIFAEKAADTNTSATEMPDVADRYKALESLAQGLFYLENMYVDESKVKEDDLVVNALRGVVSQLDPHTVLMTKDDFEQLTMGTHGRFGGVGIIVSQEKDGLIVVSPIEDTPAFKAGVKSGDKIVEIDGKEVAKLPPGQAVDLMRGKPGSTMRLKIERVGNGEQRSSEKEAVDKENADKAQDAAKDTEKEKPLPKTLIDYKLVREVIKVKSVKSQDLTNGIYYARIASFQENTYSELSNYIKTIKKGRVSGLILDLRDNPGGLLDQAVKVSDLFIESGIIVSTVGRDPKRIEREFASKPGTYTDIPVIVLVNGGSASASEIVAGALQDHKRALILGETTFGKGSVQTLISLPNGAGLKLTIARYYTPNDRSIQAKGIAPDVVVAYKEKDESAGRSDKGRNIKEADLKGHIDSKDLSDMAEKDQLTSTIKSWPENYRQDNQLKTAFSYLKGWSVFQQRR